MCYQCIFPLILTDLEGHLWIPKVWLKLNCVFLFIKNRFKNCIIQNTILKIFENRYDQVRARRRGSRVVRYVVLRIRNNHFFFFFFIAFGKRTSRAHIFLRVPTWLYSRCYGQKSATLSSPTHVRNAIYVQFRYDVFGNESHKLRNNHGYLYALTVPYRMFRDDNTVIRLFYYLFVSLRRTANANNNFRRTIISFPTSAATN